MLQQRGPLEQHLVRLLQRRVAIGAAARLDGRDRVVDRRLVLRRTDGSVPDELGVPAHDADLVALVEQVHHEVGGFLGEVELGHLLVGGHRHGPRTVDREHDGEARDLDLLLDFHRDRKRLFDRRAVVAAEPEAFLAADHDEATAIVSDVVADVPHLLPRQLERGHVGEHHPVVLLESSQVGRNLRRLHDGHVDVLRAERAGQGLCVAPVPIGEQHLRPPANDDGADGPVVVLDRVALDLHRRLVDVDPAGVERLPVAEDVLASGQSDHLRAEELAVTEEREPALGVTVTPHDDLGLEGFAELHLARQHHRFGDDLLGEGQRRRDVVDVRSGVLGGLGSGERVASVLAAVGQHDDAIRLARRQHRERELDRLKDVGPATVDLGLRAIDRRAAGERLVDDRLVAERDHAVPIAALHVLAGLSDETIGALAGRETHAVRKVEQEHDVHAVDPPRKRRPEQRQTQEGNQRAAQRQRPAVARTGRRAQPSRALPPPVEQSLAGEEHDRQDDEERPQLALNGHRGGDGTVRARRRQRVGHQIRLVGVGQIHRHPSLAARRRERVDARLVGLRETHHAAGDPTLDGPAAGGRHRDGRDAVTNVTQTFVFNCKTYITSFRPSFPRAIGRYLVAPSRSSRRHALSDPP